MARRKRPSERSTSWSVDGIRVEINETKLGVVVRRDMSNQLERILDRIRDRAKAIVEASFGKYSNTGNARDSIRSTGVKKLNQYAVHGFVEAGGAEAPYVKFLHDGADEHIIRARPENPTGLLRFLWTGRGQYEAGTEMKTFAITSGRGKGTKYLRAEVPRMVDYNDRWVMVPMVLHPGIRNPVPFLAQAGGQVTGVRVTRSGRR